MLQNQQSLSESSEKIKTGIITGFEVFDAQGGLHPGTTVVIGSYSGMGKSAFATAVARNIAKDSVPVGIVSLEMIANEIVARLVAIDSFCQSRRSSVPKLSVSQILRNVPKRTSSETALLHDTLSSIENLPIVFQDKAAYLSVIVTTIKEMVKVQHVKVIVVDYLQMILADKNDANIPREEFMTMVINQLKVLAKQYDICIVELSQLTLDENNRPYRDPQYWTFRGPQSIYDNADMVVMLNRPENETNESLKYIGKFREQTIKNTAELIVMKRNGEKSDTRYLIGFEAPSTAFYELEV